MSSEPNDSPINKLSAYPPTLLVRTELDLLLAAHTHFEEMMQELNPEHLSFMGPSEGSVQAVWLQKECRGMREQIQQIADDAIARLPQNNTPAHLKLSWLRDVQEIITRQRGIVYERLHEMSKVFSPFEHTDLLEPERLTQARRAFDGVYGSALLTISTAMPSYERKLNGFGLDYAALDKFMRSLCQVMTQKFHSEHALNAIDLQTGMLNENQHKEETEHCVAKHQGALMRYHKGKAMMLEMNSQVDLRRFFGKKKDAFRALIEEFNNDWLGLEKEMERRRDSDTQPDKASVRLFDARQEQMMRGLQRMEDAFNDCCDRFVPPQRGAERGGSQPRTR